MKDLKMLAIGAVAAMAMTAFTAGSASATTLEVGGVTQNKSVAISSSLASGTSAIISRTDGSLANTCTSSAIVSSTVSPFTTEDVGGPISTLSLSTCERTVTVHKAGALTFRKIPNTTDLTVFWGEGEMTVGSPFGTLNCKPGVHEHIGVKTGQPSGRIAWHLYIRMNCGFLVPSAIWKGTYTVTSPEGLGGVA
jgi:hypothetical protein